MPLTETAFPLSKVRKSIGIGVILAVGTKKCAESLIISELSRNFAAHFSDDENKNGL